MRPSSGMLLALVLLLFTVAVVPNCGGSTRQEPSTAGQEKNKKGRATDDTGAKNSKATGDKAEAPATDQKQKPYDEAKQPNKTEEAEPANVAIQQPATASGKRDQKGQSAAKNGKASAAKVASQAPGTPNTAPAASSSIHTTATEILDALDVAIGIAQKSGTFERNSSSGDTANDITARQNSLLQKAQAAKTDKAWGDIASDGAGILDETLKLIAANPGKSAASGPTQNHLTAPEKDDRCWFRSARVAVYIASLSSVLSVIALAIGWLLVRREINKALIDAGLL